MLTDDSFLNVRKNLLLLLTGLFLLNITNTELNVIKIFSNTIDISNAPYLFNTFNKLLLIASFYFFVRYVSFLDKEKTIYIKNQTLLNWYIPIQKKEMKEKNDTSGKIIFFIMNTILKSLTHTNLFYNMPIAFYFIVTLITTELHFLNITLTCISFFYFFTSDNVFINVFRAKKINIIKKNVEIEKYREKYTKIKQNRIIKRS